MAPPSASSRLSTLKGYVRMSWSPQNLYNLLRLSYKPNESISSSLSFKRTSLTMFQQKWSSKRLLRAYHGDWLRERQFRRRFLPGGLPPLQSNKESGIDGAFEGQGRNSAGGVGGEDRSRIPLASLMWRELEARLDVLVFRSCFAHSVYEARRLVTQGHVKLNGRVTRDPNILLAPGDIFQVDPKEMYLLRQDNSPFSKQIIKGEEAEAEEGEGEGEGGEEVSGSASEAKEPEAVTEAATEGSSTETMESTSAETISPADAPSTSTTTPTKTKTPKPKRVLPGFEFNLPTYAAPFIFIPAYLEVSFPTCSAIYVRHPTARPGYSEIPSPYDADGEIARLTWEFYKGVGRRRRGTKDWDQEESASDGGEQSGLYGGEKKKDGERNWHAAWPEYHLEQRANRAVRQGRGRWAYKP